MYMDLLYIVNIHVHCNVHVLVDGEYTDTHGKRFNG